MEFLKQWTVCVCITLVISTLLLVLSPKGSMKRFYRLVISMFIVISFVYPFTSLGKGVGIDFDKYGTSSYSIGQENENGVYEEMINKQVKACLEDNGYTGCSVTSRATLKDSELTVDEVQISVPDDYGTDEVNKCVFDKLGINARVIRIGD